jgi:hypothetical protein
MKLTSLGVDAIEKLGFLFTWNMVVPSSIAQKFSVEQFPENKPFVDKHNTLVSEFLVCRVVDIYQQYNRNMLASLIEAHPELLEDLKTTLPLKGSEIVGLINGSYSPKELLNKVHFTDKAVRDHIHKRLDFWQEEEFDYLIEARNCIVHADGYGFDPHLRAKIESKGTPWKLPLSFAEDGRIIVTPATAFTSVDVAMAQISIMDQGCAISYSIPVAEHEPKHYPIKWHG